jgi:coproporphyrinogen III oxidase
MVTLATQPVPAAPTSAGPRRLVPTALEDRRPPAPIADDGTDRLRAAAWTVAVHEDVTGLLTALDAGGEFVEEQWTREGGGGGVSRLLVDGATFEKAGVNRSMVHGVLPPEALQRLGVHGVHGVHGEVRFFASGVSVVVHPRSPRIPTVHLNVRFFELNDEAGHTVDRWFGGGTDLTPMYPQAQDAAFFHRALAELCAPFGRTLHPRFKAWCDDYFVNRHRTDERRGVGGIFYDQLRPHEFGPDRRSLHGLAAAVGKSLRQSYAPIVELRRDAAWGEEERALQLERRGRYVEFNLLHDRGTLFGLQTSARTDSVLMSLPPHASWPRPGAHAAGSLGARLTSMLAPRDWLAPDAVA